MGCASSKMEENIFESGNNARNVYNHMVSLTSTTYGILNSSRDIARSYSKASVSDSEFIETINTWELMEGLEEGLEEGIQHLGCHENTKKFGGSSQKDMGLLANGKYVVGSSRREMGLLENGRNFVGLSRNEDGCHENGRNFVGFSRKEDGCHGNARNFVGFVREEDGCHENGRNFVGSSRKEMGQSENAKRFVGSCTKEDGLSENGKSFDDSLAMEKENHKPNIQRGLVDSTKEGMNTLVGRRELELQNNPLSELKIDENYNGIEPSFRICINNSSPLFDPDVLASFQSALSDDLGDEDEVKSMHSVESLLENYEYRCPPGGSEAVVVYTTTLRGIRKTFEECNSVRAVIESYGVWVSERDVSMHQAFKHELHAVMVGDPNPISVPKVFIRGRFIGGAEEVLELHEAGRLGGLLHGIPTQCASGSGLCDGCGGARFLPCFECSGSCKILDEGNLITRCPDCNENGLIQCPICT